MLHLLDAGVPRDKIELWHHDIDGGGETFMDWPITPAYCRAVAKELGLPIYFSHREGGFKAEMLKENDRSKPIHFETPDGVGVAGGQKGTISTRRMFPQPGANLQTRWCSGSLKIDVMARAITNQPRFDGKRTLVVTGERAQESSNRAKYATLEPHRTSALKRHVDHWRPVHGHSEAQVWEAIRKHGIVPHPASSPIRTSSRRTARSAHTRSTRAPTTSTSSGARFTGASRCGSGRRRVGCMPPR